jgi:hypothetical protein
MRRILGLVPLVFLLAAVGNTARTNIKIQLQPSQTMLEVSELAFTDVLAMCTGAKKGRHKTIVFHNNDLVIYDRQRNPTSRVETNGTNGGFYPTDPGVDSAGNIYVIDASSDDIVELNPSGEWRGRFRAQERPYSLAVLSNGDLVIASPSGGKLLHIYDSAGRKLRSFGDIRFFDRVNEAQNLFLNRGKVVVDSSDNIYFVYRYAPAPEVLKFSRKGKLSARFDVEGSAIDLQLQPARKYLSTKPSAEIGGFVITNSASIDPSTGHLWICMNGSSRSGLVYEYSPEGVKLREFSFILVLPSVTHVLTYVSDILVRNTSLYVVVDSGVFLVSSTNTVSPGDFVSIQADCPEAQPWGECKRTCISGTCPEDIDCKQILESQVASGLTIVGSTCNSLGPGQGTPPKPNGGCVATVTTCDPQNNGAQVTHSTNQDCNALKYACSGTSCVVNCAGTFTTSNCNNTCGTDEDEDGYYSESDDCDDTNPNIHPGASISAYCGGPAPEGNHDDNCNNIDDWTEVCTPILVDVLGNGFALTDLAGGVRFDLSSDGIRERLSWTAQNTDDAWLALDRNSDGRINNGTELFGDFTPQSTSPNPNGFIALAAYDQPGEGGNGDGKIDSRDTIFSRLLLWQDVNHNGISEPNELHSLTSLGVGSIDIDYSESRRRDQYGNWFRYRARVRRTQGNQLGIWAYDISLLH